MERKLYRSRSDRMIAGVAGGLADYFDVDPTIVRIAIVLLALVTNGGVLLAYLIMAIVVPEEPVEVSQAPEATPGTAAPGTPAAPYASPSAGVPEETTMGPGDLPEPGEFGAPLVPDPSEGVAPPPPPPPAQATPPTGERRPSRGANAIGILLIVLGAVLLLQRFLDIDLVRLWPLVLIALGIAIMFRRGR